MPVIVSTSVLKSMSTKQWTWKSWLSIGGFTADNVSQAQKLATQLAEHIVTQSNVTLYIDLVNFKLNSKNIMALKTLLTVLKAKNYKNIYAQYSEYSLTVINKLKVYDIDLPMIKNQSKAIEDSEETQSSEPPLKKMRHDLTKISHKPSAAAAKPQSSVDDNDQKLDTIIDPKDKLIIQQKIQELISEAFHEQMESVRKLQVIATAFPNLTNKKRKLDAKDASNSATSSINPTSAIANYPSTSSYTTDISEAKHNLASNVDTSAIASSQIAKEAYAAYLKEYAPTTAANVVDTHDTAPATTIPVIDPTLTQALSNEHKQASTNIRTHAHILQSLQINVSDLKAVNSRHEVIDLTLDSPSSLSYKQIKKLVKENYSQKVKQHAITDKKRLKSLKKRAKILASSELLDDLKNMYTTKFNLWHSLDEKPNLTSNEKFLHDKTWKDFMLYYMALCNATHKSSAPSVTASLQLR